MSSAVLTAWLLLPAKWAINLPRLPHEKTACRADNTPGNSTMFLVRAAESMRDHCFAAIDARLGRPFAVSPTRPFADPHSAHSTEISAAATFLYQARTALITLPSQRALAGTRALRTLPPQSKSVSANASKSAFSSRVTLL